MDCNSFESPKTHTRQTGIRRFWRKHYAIPPEHGAWVWWIGPLLIGAAAGSAIRVDLLVLIVTALAAFLVRQPLTLLVKVVSGLRPASDRSPAQFWTAIHGGICLAGAAGLVVLGHAKVLLLGLLAAPLLLWYFYLVSRKSERHQRGMEYATAAVLALALPAAYWVCGGASAVEPWILWGLVTLHSVTTVIHVAKILELRRTKRIQDVDHSRHIIATSLPFAMACLIVSPVSAYLGFVSWFAILAYLVPILDIAHATVWPPAGIKPMQLGLRQLATSSLFVVLMMVAVVL
jgi:hypothetical protein